MNLQKQLRCVYLHAFTSTLHFTDAVWVALLAACGFTLAQIGLAEGVFHGVSLLCEVPSGMAADLWAAAHADLRRCAGRCLRRHHGVCAQSRVHLRGHGAESAGLQPALRHHGSPDLRQPETAGRERDYIKVDAKASIFMKLASALGALASLLAGVLTSAGYYLADAAVSAVSALAAANSDRTCRHRRTGRPREAISYKNCPPGCVCIFWTVSTACAAAHRRGALSWPTRSSRCRPT